MDYRALKAITVKDRFPTPSMDELLDELFGASVFSKLDLHVGYHQLQLHPSDVCKTAFNHEGHYEFLVMPCRLSDAPSSFQATMNQVFWSLLHRRVLVFFNDILAYSHSWESHLQHLQIVLDTLHQHQFYAKLSQV